MAVSSCYKHTRNASTRKCWSFKIWWCINTQILTLLAALSFLDIRVDAYPIGIRSENQFGSTTTITATPLPKKLTPQREDFSSFDMTPGLHTPSISNYQQLPSLPDSCSTYNTIDGECSTSMVAVSVTYDDCDEKWTLCHCSSANISLDQSVERLGKIPVGLRRYVATTVVLPGLGDDESHAYTLTNGDLHMFGNCETESWIHEVVHAYDWMPGEPVSNSQQWLDAVSKDSCVTDNYGTSDSAEEFAQLSVLKVFSLIYGRLPTGWESNCMSNQLSFLETLPIFDKSTLFGNTCAIPSSNLQATLINGGLRLGIDPARSIKSVGPEFDSNMPLRIHPKGGPIECDDDEEDEGGNSGTHDETAQDPDTPTSVPPVSGANDPGNGALGLASGLGCVLGALGLMIFGLVLVLDVII